MAFSMAVGVAVGVAVIVVVGVAVEDKFEKLEKHLSGLNDIQKSDWSGVLNWGLQ